jgi:hypothetical protein
MKKRLLFILLLLPILGISQINDTWDAVNIGSTPYGKIYSGSTLVWEKPATINTVFTLSTTSTSATWSPQTVTKTGDVLHWEVTGAVTTSADVNDPTFDFSTAGTKNIVVTSTDGSGGLTVFWCYLNSLTSLDVSKATNLTDLSCYGNSLTSLDVSTNTNLTSLSCATNSLTSLNVSTNTNLTDLLCASNSLTSLNVLGATDLTKLYCYSNSLTSLDVSTNTNLTDLLCEFNSLTKTSVDNILDDLISFGLNGNTFNCSDQDPAITPDATKVSDLEALGWIVYQ